MMSSTPINHFDREKPFYPLIMNYLVLLHGIKEFILSGFLKQAEPSFSKTGLLKIKYTRKIEYEFGSKLINVLGAIPNDAKINDILEEYIAKAYSSSEVPLNLSSLPKMAKELEAGISKIAGPLELASKYQEAPIEVSLELLENEMGSNYAYLLGFTMRSASNLLMLAYETTYQYHDNGPLWEFLRHCRNAAAHNGRFRFSDGEPRRPAKWGTLSIEKTLQDSALFPIDDQTKGFLGAGDAISLLWDVEQAYPNMKVSI